MDIISHKLVVYVTNKQKVGHAYIIRMGSLIREPNIKAQLLRYVLCLCQQNMSL